MCWLRFGLLLLPAFLLVGCIRTATKPMSALEYPLAESTQKNLLILVRGIGSGNESFDKYGLVDEVRSRNLPFDIVAPDAHFGYYKSETVEDRLNEDFILPARKRGYQRIWLAGFSMGGLGSLFYLRKYADQVDGVFLISPFVGWRPIIKEINKAGGIAAWDAITEDNNDWQRLIWTWIKRYSASQNDYPPIYLGYGQNDLLTGHGPALLATALPVGHAFSVPGGHDHDTFKGIFLMHLNQLDQLIGNANALESKPSAQVKSNPVEAL